MFKKGIAMLMMSFVFVFAFVSLPDTGSANGDYGTENTVIEPPFDGQSQFTTGDGNWDGVIPNSQPFHVRLDVSGTPIRSHLQLRLCNSESGNCTAFKQLNDSVEFTNVAGGIYYIDIVSTTRNTSGTVTFEKF